MKATAVAKLILLTLLLCPCSNSFGQDAAQPGEESPAKPPAEQAALDRFRAEMAELETWRIKREAELEKGPIRASLPLELARKSSAVKSDGLPADLKRAWDQFQSSMKKVEPIIEKMGGPPEKITEKQVPNPAVIAEATAAMGPVLAEIGAAAEALRNVAKKYGIDTLGHGSPEVAAEPDARLKKFEADFGAVIQWNNAKVRELQGNIKAQLALSDEFVKRLKAVDVEGLPEDLRAAYSRFAISLGDHNAIAAKGPLDATAEAAMARDNPEQYKVLQTTYNLVREAYEKNKKTLTEMIAKYNLKP